MLDETPQQAIAFQEKHTRVMRWSVLEFILIV